MEISLPFLLCVVLVLGLAGPGCEEQSQKPKPFNAGDYSFVIKIGSLDRKYIVHVPSAYNGKTPMPVVLMLHGGGGTARAAMWETGWSTTAEQAGFLAVFPEATPPDPSKPGRFYGNPQTWNDGSGRFHSGLLNIDDVGFINALIDDMLSRFAADEQRIFVTGISNGASMTYRVGVELSHRIAAIAPVSGHLWLKEPKLARPVPLIYTNGTEDPLNPLEGGGEIRSFSGRIESRPPVRESVMRWVEMLGCSPESEVIYDNNGVRGIAYGRCQEDSEVVFYTVEGLGHTWPGGRSLLPESMVGKTSDRMKANDVIWEFFKKHPMKRPTTPPNR